MSKKPTQEQIEKFFDMARYGEHDLIKMLESMPEYRDIEDSRGINIFNHLVSNNHHAVIKEVLEKGLSSYSMFRKVGIDMANSIYRNDRHYNTFNLLKKEDKQTMAENGWYCLVEYNNIKTLSDIGIEDLAKNIQKTGLNYTNVRANFHTFGKCSEEMLEMAMPIYIEISSDISFLRGVFRGCKENIARGVVLADNIKGGLTPEIEAAISEENPNLLSYLKNRKLNEKLSSELESKNDTQIIKGKKI